MDRPNNRAELIALARDAARGITPALAVFRELARRAGYEGRPGGIHLPGGAVTRCCASWAELAEQVLDPEMYYTQDRIVAALGLTNATGAPAVEAKPTERATFRPAEAITVTTGDAGPSVRLTPAPADTKREATDAEVLQLLAVLDAGGSVHRALYQEWGVLDAGPFRLNLDAVNRAARDAVRFGLARQAFVNREYVLTAEPVHLDIGAGSTACARYTGERAGGTRLRVTTDPAKVTHERCKR